MNIIKLLVIVFLAGILIQTTDSAFNTISAVSLDKVDGHSRVIMTFTHPATYSIEPDIGKKVIKLLFPQCSIDPSISTLGLTNSRVEKIGLQALDESNSAAEIYLRDTATSVYHSLSRDGKILTLRFKSRKSLLAITTDPMIRKKRLTKKEAEKAFAKKMENLGETAGKELFRDAMISFQKNMFEEAEEKFDEFLKFFPKSIYRETAMYIRAETLYRISKKNPARIKETLDAFRVANFTYPLSEYIPRGNLRIADLYLDRNYDVEALAVYESLIKAEPEGKFVLSALRGKANVYLKRSEYSKAYNELEKILLLYPTAKEVREARFKIAEAFYYTKRYETALKIFEDSHKKWPSYVSAHADTLVRFADTYYKMNKLENALVLYLELINLFPKVEEGKGALNRIAEIFLMQNRPLAAIKILGLQARRIPEEPQGMESRLRLAALGHSPRKYLDEKETLTVPYPDYFNPLETYNDIIEKHPGTSQARDALFQKANLLFQNNQHIRSILTLKEMMKKFPRSRFSRAVVELVKDNLFQLIRIYHDQKGFYRVLATYYENFDPFLVDVEDAEIILNVADAYYETGLFERAVEKYEQAAKLDRRGIFKERLRYGMGKAYTAMGSYSDAEEILLPFIDRFRYSTYAPDALHLLGDVYYAQKMQKNAIAVFKYAKSLDAGNERNSRSAYHVGIIYKNWGDYKAAVRYFNNAVETYKPVEGKADERHVVESYYQLIEAAYLSGDFGEAIRYADFAVKRYPENVQNGWARYMISDSQVKLSQDEKAMASLKSVVEGEPATVYGKVASATIDNIDWKLRHKELFAY